MSKVLFTFNTGRQRLASPKDAELLRRLGHGSYATRDMADKTKIEKAFPGTDDPRTVEEVDAYIKAENAKVKGDGLDDLDAEALHALAKECGVKVHYKAGAEKVREALRSAA